MTESPQFFSITHSFQVNAIPMGCDAQLPTQEQFELSIPAPFKLASQISYIDSKTLAPIRKIGGIAVELAEFLNIQAQKIDMMMGYILTVQDDEKFRQRGVKFGGSSLSYIAPQALNVDQLVTLKVFIKENNCAVFCIGRVVNVSPHLDGFLIEVDYAMINDEDQEHLVRASLQVQTLQLKERAQQRHENN